MKSGSGSSTPQSGPDGGSAVVESEKAAMEQRPPRMSPGGSRPGSGPPAKSRLPAACRPSAEPKGAQLWLFPSAPGLSSALSRRSEETRQMCCTRDRLAVLERGGAGVQVHQLPVGSDGAKKPKCIKLGKKMKIHSVDQGAEHMLILSSDGKPFEYNYNVECERLQCILQEKCIIQITCGDYHSLALSKGGELFAWGQNLHGQLGLGKVLDSTPTPRIVEHLSGVPLAQISAGKAHSMALSMSGNIYSWGRNDFGQLGLGHTNNEDFPSLIEALDSQKVEFLACGGSHTAVLTKDGLLFTFGAGKYGQLGHNSTENELKPCLVTELVGNRVTQIACGRWHTLAYVSDLGKVFSFGSGKEGQLGNGGTHNQLIPLPMKLPSNEEIRFESRNSEKELILIAGGSQSILLWMKKENPYVNLRRKIPILNEGTVKRWIADVGTKQWQNTKREIREIFSSPACLTGSFVRERISTEKMFVHLDLNKARNAFKELTQKDCITNMITTCLRDNLLKYLPFPSHQEALGVFFLLPECPMMHDCNNWENLVIPFAEAICKMSDKSSGALEEYWASLQESAFIELVQMFKRVITAQLCHCTQSAESNRHIRVLLEMLKRLHRFPNRPEEEYKQRRVYHISNIPKARNLANKLLNEYSSAMARQLAGGRALNHGPRAETTLAQVNKTKCQLPENIFQISELTHCLDFYEDARRRSCLKMSLDTPVDLQYPVIFSHFPFIFNILSKIKLLHADSHIKMQEKKIRAYKQWTGIVEDGGSSLALLPTFNLTVRRSHLIEDVFNQLNQFENEDLRGELMVSFSGEIEHDFGGVRAEFFHCLFDEMTRPEYGMFMYPEESSYMWFPVRPKFEEKRYFYFGILCGLSLFNYNVADIPFPLALFKKLLDQTPSLEDLKELSPVLGRSLQTLLDDERANFEEEFYTYFNVHWDKTDVELIPDGSYIVVNQTNKTDYVSKYVDYIFNTSIKAVYEEFQRGFYKVCDKEVIEIFRPEELKDVIIGYTDYDWETFEKNAQCGPGYDDSSHPTIVMFWKALRKLTLEEKKKFLVFLTGTDRIQVKGIKNMAITFCCPEDVNEKDPMRAQTCFSILCLPKYSTMERVEEALQVAINNNRGFG